MDDLKNINQIDMECEAPDDIEFGGPMRTISASIDEKGIKTTQNFKSFLEPDYSHMNEIDMECEAPDDDDFGSIKVKPAILEQEEHVNGDDAFHDGPCKTGTILTFNDDETIENIKEAPVDEDEHELVGESMEKQNEFISQGEVESDYLKKLQKKHAASNKKGAYNLHFHFAGNPKLEAELFNHDMGTDGCKAETNAEVNGESSGEAAGEAAGGEACSESLEKYDYKKLSEDLLSILQFEISKCDDGSYMIIDSLDSNNHSVADNAEDAKWFLSDYFYYTFIAPLEYKTNQKFIDWGDWLKWYDENKDLKYEQDIKYIDLWVNHFDQIGE